MIIMYEIILASSSPRRRDILEQIGTVFSIRSSSKEEVMGDELPQDMVMRLSKLKAEDIASSACAHSIIIGADTIVAINGKVLGKPHSEEEAKEMLLQLQGNSHQVCTGVTVIIKEVNGPEQVFSFVEQSEVFVHPMSEQEIMDYIKTKEPMDKAGAYGIQGKFAPYIKRIEGDYYNIVGLPVSRLYIELKQRGIDLRTGYKNKSKQEK